MPLKPEHTELDRKPCYLRDGQSVVLCKVGGYQPFVTWIEVTREDGAAYFVQGHYYSKLADALADFSSRN